ncbi:MAG: thiol protease/hemagglutinin PrtT [Bacteroidales bacterium]|nr:thiol protease/hemagglutinin PrtT [Bacteroidales bacterium]
MKRIFVFVLLALVATVNVFAAHVDATRAARVAVSFWNTNRPDGVKAVESMTDVSYLVGQPNIYLFTPESGQGFILMSADDRVLPILGYSFVSPVCAELPTNAANWFTGLSRQIEFISSRTEMQTTEVAAAWDMAENGHILPLMATIEHAVDPMLSTVWNQSPYYNDMCPFDETRGALSVSGCTVTAMTQIMKFWNHPYSGVGSHSYNLHIYNEDNGQSMDTLLSVDFSQATYDWDIMPRALNARSHRDLINAVALITYHAGVAVEMGYSASSSGAWVHAYGDTNTICAENALWRHFKYNRTTMQSYRRSSNQINDSIWQSIIDIELLAGRPVLYTGYDSAYSGGHAFVCDGADGNGMYDFNWGWGGHYNGWYYLSNLAPGNHGTEIGNNDNGEFNHGQGITVGILPVPEQIDTVYLTGLVCPVKPIVVGNHTYNSTVQDTVRERTTMVIVDLVEDDVRTCGFRPGTGEGTMDPISSCPSIGFVMPECEFTHPTLSFIGWNSALDGSGVMYQPGDTITARGNRNVYAQWGTPAGIGDVTAPEMAVSIGPNPAADIVTVRCSSAEMESGVCEVAVFDALGRQISNMKVAAVDGVAECQISVSQLAAGLYNVRISTPQGFATRRIIKQ